MLIQSARASWSSCTIPAVVTHAICGASNSQLDSAFGSDCGVDASVAKGCQSRGAVRSVAPEMTTKQKENLFKMDAEEGVAEVNRLVHRLVVGVDMSRLRPSRSYTILDLLLAVRSNGLEEVVDVLVSQFMEVIIGVSAVFEGGEQ